MPSIELPENYGLVIACNIVAPIFFMFFAQGRVMRARKCYGISYPNLYAVAGQSKKKGGKATGDKVTEAEADLFNAVQRGHQNPLEIISDLHVMSLIAGLTFPITTALCGCMWLVGRVSYAVGYNGSGGRYSGGLKLGILHFLGYMTLLCLNIYTAAKWCNLL